MGMIFGAMCTVTGVLMIDLPMPIIVRNFANYYNHLQAHSKFPKKLRRKILPIEIPKAKPHRQHNAMQHTINTTTDLVLITSRIKSLDKINNGERIDTKIVFNNKISQEFI